jgi:hypothetical protein
MYVKKVTVPAALAGSARGMIRCVPLSTEEE